MKRLLYVFVLMMALTSCGNEFEDVFNQTPTERKTAAISELIATLSGAEHGWKTTMIIRKGTKCAGDFFVMKFAPIEGGSSGQVTIANGFRSKTSEFKIYHETGVVLNFNSFNEVFHWLVQPTQMLGTKGLGGNMEYIFIKEENGKLIFKGKENGNEMILEKATAQDCDMTDIQKNFENLNSFLTRNFSGIRVTKGLGATPEKPFLAKFRDLGFPELKGKFYGLNYLIDGKQVWLSMANFILTHNELILSKPLVVGSDTVDRFVYNKDRNTWEITNKGIEGCIFASDLPPVPSPKACDIFIAEMGKRWFGWSLITDIPGSGKMADFMSEISKNTALHFFEIHEHYMNSDGEDLGRGIVFTGGWLSYAFIPIDYVKLGESEMKIVRNGNVISNIDGINELLTTNPYVLKFMNALFNPKGWSLYLQSGGSGSTAYSDFVFYDIEEPSISMHVIL